MNTLAVLLLAGTTAAGGIFGKPHVSGKRFLRPHVVMNGPAPPGGPINMSGSGGGGGSLGGSAGMMGGMGGLGGVPGLGGPGAALRGRRFPNTRSQIYFVEPTGMKIGWQSGSGPNGEKVFLPAQLSTPARYNFNQGYIYRLKLTDIPDQPGLVLYPTIEVAPSTPVTDAYLTHNAIPIVFEEQDFEQIKAGNFITKVIYLPDPKYQELAVAGVETLVSTRLEPGIDPILEADRRGTILAIVRVGAIDLEMPASGTTSPGSATTGTNADGAGVSTLPPNSLPPGAVPNAPPIVPSVPVDNSAPVSPAPPSPSTPPAAPEAVPGDAKPVEEPKADAVPADAPKTDVPPPAAEVKPEPAAEAPK